IKSIKVKAVVHVKNQKLSDFDAVSPEVEERRLPEYRDLAATGPSAKRPAAIPRARVCAVPRPYPRNRTGSFRGAADRASPAAIRPEAVSRAWTSWPAGWWLGIPGSGSSP